MSILVKNSKNGGDKIITFPWLT